MEFDILEHTVYRVIFWMPWLMCDQLYHPDDSFPAVQMWVEGFPHETTNALAVVMVDSVIDEEDQEVRIFIIPKPCIVSCTAKRG